MAHVLPKLGDKLMLHVGCIITSSHGFYKRSARHAYAKFGWYARKKNTLGDDTQRSHFPTHSRTPTPTSFGQSHCVTTNRNSRV